MMSIPKWKVMSNWKVTPTRWLLDVPRHPTLDDKIDIFAERILGWKLDVADRLINGVMDPQEHVLREGDPNNAYAVLDIVLSYFEMIGKYYDGYTEKGMSRRYFREGMCHIFPELRTYPLDVMNKATDSLYADARCEMYHLGRTGTNVFLGEPFSVELGKPPVKGCIAIYTNGRIEIKPQKLVLELKDHVLRYVALLKDPANVQLRRNFDACFKV
jgi:hypothetical protein